MVLLGSGRIGAWFWNEDDTWRSSTSSWENNYGGSGSSSSWDDSQSDGTYKGFSKGGKGKYGKGNGNKGGYRRPEKSRKWVSLFSVHVLLCVHLMLSG